jgi:hypothetical protein
VPAQTSLVLSRRLKRRRLRLHKANALVLQQQQQGLDAQKGYFDAGNKPLSDIATKGVGDYAALEAAIPGLTAPITMDQKTLEATPGYKFNLDQGIRGVNLSSVASGMSGAQAKAAAKYATGLADSTYQNQFNNANTNKTTPSISFLARLSSAQARLVSMVPTQRPPATPI